MPSPDQPSFHIRLPAELMKRVKIAAAENGRSINAELVRRIESSFELDETDRETAIRLISEALKVLKTSTR